MDLEKLARHLTWRPWDGALPLPVGTVLRSRDGDLHLAGSLNVMLGDRPEADVPLVTAEDIAEIADLGELLGDLEEEEDGEDGDTPPPTADAVWDRQAADLFIEWTKPQPEAPPPLEPTPCTVLFRRWDPAAGAEEGHRLPATIAGSADLFVLRWTVEGENWIASGALYPDSAMTGEWTVSYGFPAPGRFLPAVIPPTGCCRLYTVGRATVFAEDAGGIAYAPLDLPDGPRWTVRW